MSKPRIREAIVVEGAYDRARVAEAVDATIVETHGFGIFNDPARRRMLQLLAQERGLIIFTDSDSAGAVIRAHLCGIVPQKQLKHAYSPLIPGKERRKSALSKAGLLGVEGINAAAIRDALLQAGATVEGAVPHIGWTLTKQRMMADGLSGGAGSAVRRQQLLQRLGLPQELSANRLREVLEATQTEDSYTTLLEELTP